ncbi:divalent-cation tolerance protein CutA [Woodsholea maritima]|uniref:divalent-cation tolerance protein CutA n=1 Tax=Woodsholea maritima TaxID=240237 RepID=UPI0003759A5B|nr:divalent-cation tolerance protein CutA [Woodsholea maritima]
MSAPAPHDLCLVYTTWPAHEGEDIIAPALKTLVSEHLIACANRLAPSVSYYEWQGALQEEREVIVILKTTAQKLSALEARFRTLHPYDEPCFIVLNPDLKTSAKSFIDWVNTQTMTPQ